MSDLAETKLIIKSWRYFCRKRFFWSAGLFLMVLALAWGPIIILDDGHYGINLPIQIAALVVMAFGFPPNGVAPKDFGKEETKGKSENDFQTAWQKEANRSLLIFGAGGLALGVGLYVLRYGFLALDIRAALSAVALGMGTGIFALSVTHLVTGPPSA